jgi:hypothetical protein
LITVWLSLKIPVAALAPNAWEVMDAPITPVLDPAPETLMLGTPDVVF